MLRTTSGLSRPMLKGVSQVTASLGATLAAAVIWSAVPHPSAVPPSPPELTSGGKFAARAMDAVAYDGLDTMPLPRVAPAPAEGLYRTAWEGTPPLLLTPDRSARGARPAKAAAHAEPRRAPAADAPQRAAGAAAVAAGPAAESDGEDGFLARTMPRILPVLASTARGAWAVTASAGESLVARIVPQVP